jgi:phage terminase small subunit
MTSRAPTQRQFAFIAAYNETQNAAEAYRRAYNSKGSAATCATKGSRLLKMAHIMAHIARGNAVVEAKVAKAAEIIGISKEPLLRKLGAMADSSMKNYVRFNEWGEPQFDFEPLSDDAWKAIRELTITETKMPQPEGAPEKYLVSTKLRLHDSLGPIRELCQLLGFTKQDGTDDDAERMTKDELIRSVFERLSRLAAKVSSRS